MGQALGTSGKGSVNIELNIVPFIDLMSCLTAFLLVTAVWVNVSSLENESVGKKAGGVDEPEKPRIGILLEYDQILVQQTPSGEARQLPAFDWPKLEAVLRELKTSDEWPQVEIAATSSGSHVVEYQQLIAAMDTAVKAGYPRVGITDSTSLSLTLAR